MVRQGVGAIFFFEGRLRSLARVPPACSYCVESGAEEGAKAAAGARVDARQFSRLYVEFVGERGQLRAERFDPVAFLARVADLGLEFGEGDFVQREGRVLRPDARDLFAVGQYGVKRVFRRHEEIVSFELKNVKRKARNTNASVGVVRNSV